jgi:hypothetical protein
VACEDAVESVVVEGERRDRGVHELDAGKAAPGDRQHRRALVEPYDIAVHNAREVTGAASDVEDKPRTQPGDEAGEALDLRGFGRLVGRRVVLRRSPFVVIPHRR